MLWYMIMLFQFSSSADISAWRIVNDGVMGGLSRSNIELTNEGYGRFHGAISLENNGGFAMVQLPMRQEVGDAKSMVIRLKGDGKKYQFRIKANERDYYSYIYEAKTSGDWETITIPLAEMEAFFRGRDLSSSIPNFDQPKIEMVAILYGQKKAESFELLIESIGLE